ncbi:CaiB/BaiF CoA transferase family protein [Marinimicrobium agarilyticum]|uniref:CaiB/BaiF CoA transferase family protein n=1 Tax=Marinimicrobium agarilyticum TaxID=306546 RepID=UPI000417A445|nr:CaiB/BaiF CoA-transferase family protein [Marinimicrobium agarilyticum]
MTRPLEGIRVLDFTQFLAGPVATLRLSDLGARVIKVEHYEQGDLTRKIYAPQLNLDGESAFFQAINRDKESLKVNLKNAEDHALISRLVAASDVVVHNFRPGVMNRLGLDYDTLKSVNPTLVYGEISGYGADGPWRHKPGQDLLVQALSGLTQLSGAESDGPVPMGLAVADYLAGSQLVQGVLAALVSGEGTRVEVSMLEAILDFQFEPLTLFYQDGEPVSRGEQNPAHSLVAAPYGLYQTQNGYLALAMGSITALAELLACEPLKAYDDPSRWFELRDPIKKVLAKHLNTQTTEHWLGILEPADIWCAPVLNWRELVEHDGFKALSMLQSVTNSRGFEYQTTRCPIRFNNERLTAHCAAPLLGEHSDAIKYEFANEVPHGSHN